MQSLTGSIGITVAALASVLVLAWLLLKGLAGLSRRGSLGGELSVRATLAIGQRERVVVVTWGEQDYLLGVTGSAVSMIDRRPAARKPPGSGVARHDGPPGPGATGPIDTMV